MKLTGNLTCATCGEPIRGSVERLNGCALLDVDPSGAAEYAGETDVWWDEQRSVSRDPRRLVVICPNAHEWTVGVEHDAPHPIMRAILDASESLA
jgi:hypothetical protein